MTQASAERPDRRTASFGAIIRQYRHYLKRADYRMSFAFALILFIASWFVNYFAILYATDHASNSVTDIVLSNIPVFDVNALFVYGTLFLVVFSTVVVMLRPQRIPFALYGVALFFITRSIFTSLTHVAPFVSHADADFSPYINRMFFGGDLFFSGHTGMPFLAALAFWNEKTLRYVYLAGSLFFAAIVLMGHLHYSIDVASAYFITYGIFQIAIWMYPGEWHLFSSSGTHEGV